MTTKMITSCDKCNMNVAEFYRVHVCKEYCKEGYLSERTKGITLDLCYNCAESINIITIYNSQTK